MATFISIQDAADLSKKSIQTIRRAIKAKKLKCKRKKTPQGFNYLVNQESLCDLFRISLKEKAKKEKSKTPPKAKKVTTKKEENISVEANDFKDFTVMMEKFLNQHVEERQNFMRLINTLQERLFVLENQLNLLKEPAAKSWYHFWK